MNNHDKYSWFCHNFLGGGDITDSLHRCRYKWEPIVIRMLLILYRYWLILVICYWLDLPVIMKLNFRKDVLIGEKGVISIHHFKMLHIYFLIELFVLIWDSSTISLCSLIGFFWSEVSSVIPRMKYKNDKNS